MLARNTQKRRILSVSNDENISDIPSRSLAKKKQRKSSSYSKEFPENIFTRLITKAGLTLNVQGNKIDKDSISYWQKLNRLLEAHDDNVDETIESFCTAMEESLENEKLFISCLMPSELIASFDDLGVSSSQMPSTVQDSLAKMMLHCSHLQHHVVNYLLKKLPLYAENENVQVNACFGVSDSNGADIVNMPRLIINQLRWIDIINESAAVASQLIELSSVMQSGIACDIISFIPDFLADDDEHGSVALKLCDLLNDGPEGITSAVFDALSNLIVCDEIEKQIHDLALSYLSTAVVENIPVIVKYMLKSCSSVESAKQIIMELHPHLDFSTFLSAANENKDLTKSSTSLIADVMYSCMQFQSVVSTAWISTLEKTRSADLHVGDIIAFLLLCNLNSSQHRKSAINVFHSKLKKGLISNEILKGTIEMCNHIISSRFKSIRQLAQGLLWHSHPALKRTAAFLYELFLLNLDNFCKQETIGVLVEHISSMTKEVNSESDMALDVLCSVAKQKPSVLVAYSNFLRDALDQMNLMSLLQARKSYCILSSLAYSGATDTLTMSMRDEMHMTLQKQLTNISDRYRHIGIIGSVTTLVAMSNMVQNSNSSLQKEISSLLHTLNYVLRNDIKGWSIFFDEVFITLTNKTSISDFLVKQFNDDAQNKLQDNFLTDFKGNVCSTSSSSQIECSYRYGLLSAEEQKETAVGIQLITLLLNSRSRHITSLLCSVFCAISSLEQISTGSLGEIDALLCCPILIHDERYEDKDEFKELSMDKTVCILDSLFAIVNWFRELVSVFCVENDPEVSTNVLVRLKQICNIQETLERLLTLAPSSYAPPIVNSSNIENLTSAKPLFKSQPVNKAPSATQKQKISQNVTIQSTAGPSKVTKLKKEKKSVSSNINTNLYSSSYRPYLRELGKEVFALLQYSLRCGKKAAECIDNGKTLQPSHLLFLLNDLTEKLRHRLSVVKLPFGFGQQLNVGVGYERLDQVPVVEVVEMAVKLFPHICRHLEDIISYFEDCKSKAMESPAQSDDSISSQSSGVFVLQHGHVTECYSALIEIINLVMSWPGMDDESNKGLLDSALKHLSTGLRSQTQNRGSTILLSNSFRYLQKLSGTVPSSSASHMLLKLLVTLYEFADGHKSQQLWMGKKISSTAHDFLKKEWNDAFTTGSTQKQNATLNGLFNFFLKYSDDMLDNIEQFLENSLSYLLGDSDKERTANNPQVIYPNLTKSNFYIFYKGMIEALSSQAASIPLPSKGATSGADNIDLLLRWSEVVKVLDMLIRVLKTFSTRLTLAPALKFARSTVESFIRTGIPVCELTFIEHQDDVISLLKKVQISTRQLQHIACHSKVSKDSSLTNHVPALKRCLETFVYRVKAMMVLHNCHEAFWLGNLKNRNLQGEELLSQVPTDRSSSDNEEEAENSAIEGTGNSYSESY